MMAKAQLKLRRDGKVSLTRAEHGKLIIRLKRPGDANYRPGSQRERAWQVVSLMDGLTVNQGCEILELLEPNIQGKVGRPIGWIVDAVDRGLAEIHSR